MKTKVQLRLKTTFPFQNNEVKPRLGRDYIFPFSGNVTDLFRESGSMKSDLSHLFHGVLTDVANGALMTVSQEWEV